jgi:cell division protein FtsQ
VKKTKESSAAEKRRILVEQRRNRQLKLLAAALVAGIIAEGLFILAKSDNFDIRKIQFSGNRKITTNRLAKLAGITTKTNIFDMRAADVVARLRTDPWISTVTVKRQFPLTVAITVVERQPFAVVSMNGRFYLVDRAATVIEAPTSNVYPGLAVVAGTPTEDDKEPGLTLTGPALRNALAVLGGLDADIAAAIESMAAPTIDGLSFKLKGGPVVMYGKSEMQKQKNYAIKVILKEAVNEGRVWQYIDVRVPSNPAAKAAA